MKTGNLIFLPLLCFMVNNAFAQKTLVTYNAAFEWPTGQDELSATQKVKADSIYNSLAAGESVKLNMLSKEEEKLPDLERGLLSFRRATALVAHCVQNKYNQNEFYAEMVPFQMPHTLKSNDLTYESHKLFMSKKSQTYFVFVRPKTMATSKAAAYFDASVNNEVQEFTFNWEDEIDVYPGGCTHIHIPANSLQRSNGQKPLNENVTVRVAQYLDMDAIALKAMTTSSRGKKLQTAGMWYIEVLSNNEKLEMKPGTKYNIRVCFEGDVKPMKVFTGQMNGTMLDWKEQTDDKVILPGEVSSANIENVEFFPNLNPDSDFSYRNGEESGYMIDGVYDPEGGKYYDLQLNDFGWINCDAFDESDKLTDLMVSGEISEGMSVMLVFAKRKSVLPGYFCGDMKSVQFTNVASEEAAMLVAFKPTDKNGNIVKYTKLITPGNQKNIRVVTEKSTLAELQAEIKGKLADVY
ncbi:MAG TPA: hypothetical protein VK177_08395 [Flavobacteriales bacterium]|nr:hypothetical protein [Flavobacteriales bacterium]